MIFIYSAYNLCIQSNRLFPELKALPEHVACQSSPDIFIDFRPITPAEELEVDGNARFLGLLANSKVGRFLVEDGSRIVVEAAPGISEEVLRPCVLGPIISVLLRQRGLLVLHASSVGNSDGAVAFLGHSGWGKSTLANALYNQGFNLLTDDVMAIQLEQAYPLALSAFPQVRLLPDSASSLGYDFEDLSLIHPEAPKRNNRIERGFSTVPLPLKRLYILAQGAEMNIHPLTPQQSVVELIRHSRVMNLLTSKDFVTRHLNQCSELVQKVPTYRLERPRSLAQLPTLVELVKQDINQSLSERHPIPAVTSLPATF